MRKLILIFILVSLASCSKNNADSKKDDPVTIEGTVVKLFSMLIPQAYADTVGSPLSGDSKEAGYLPASADGSECPAARCAFLLDMGIKVGSPEVNEEVHVIAVTPVINGKFKFTLSSSKLSATTAIRKVVVRGWDPIKKIALPKSGQDREITLSPEEVNNVISKPEQVKVDITPESTVNARRRVEVLKSNLTESPEDSDFIQVIADVFGNSVESVRDIALRLVGELMNPSSEDQASLDIFENLVTAPPGMAHSDLFKPQGVALRLKEKYKKLLLADMAPAQVISELTMLNTEIQAARMGQKNQLAKYPFAALSKKGYDYYKAQSDMGSLRAQLESVIAEQGGSSSAALDLNAQISEKDAILVVMSKELEDECRPHKIYADLEQSGDDMEEMKMSVSVDDPKFVNVSTNLFLLQIAVSTQGLPDQKTSKDLSASCVAAHDFNSSRSNKDKR